MLYEVITYVRAFNEPSASVAVTVPTTVALALFSSKAKVAGVTTGVLSFTLFRLMVTVASAALVPSDT